VITIIGRAGVPMEVMGLMLGQFVDDYTITCVDVFAMPQVRAIKISSPFLSFPFLSFPHYRRKYHDKHCEYLKLSYTIDAECNRMWKTGRNHL
jgi:proteasome lid subunit RPN8/RPN11